MQVSLSIAIIGLSGSGKTSLINSYINSKQTIFPTAGFNIKYLTCNLKSILTYDCSGQPRTMATWNMFSSMVDSIIFCIDCSDQSTFPISRKYLLKFLQTNKYMKKKNLCIALTKSDIKHRLPKETFYKALQIDKLTKLVGKVYVKQTSAFNKDGLEQCLDWLLKNSQGNKQININ